MGTTGEHFYKRWFLALLSFILLKIRKNHETKFSVLKQSKSGGPGQDVQAVYGGVGGGQAHTEEQDQLL